MQRIFLQGVPLSDHLLISNSGIHHQITRVMRARVWDEIVFFDWISPTDYHYKITHITKSDFSCELLSKTEKNLQPGPWLTLFQALPNKIAKAELITQKCAELGYEKIVFFQAQRSDPYIEKKLKLERLEKIAIEATEQCWGNTIPKIEFRSLQERDMQKALLLHPGENSQHISICHRSQNYKILVWPEWGFTDSEIHNFTQSWAELYEVWERILRLETVSIALGFYLKNFPE